MQALGWPALARIFMAWYSPSERGRWYSLLSTNQNAGAKKQQLSPTAQPVHPPPQTGPIRAQPGPG